MQKAWPFSEFSRRPRREVATEARARGALAVTSLLCAGAAAAALLAWPDVGLGADPAALASVEQPAQAGTVEYVGVRTSGGKTIPIEVRDGRLWPRRAVPTGENLTVEVTVQRPAWAGWLVGHTDRKAFHHVTPSAELRGRWLEVPTAEPVTFRSTSPSGSSSSATADGPRTLRFAEPRTSVRSASSRAEPTGRTRQGTVGAAPWERLSRRCASAGSRRASACRRSPSRPQAALAERSLTVTFSRPD